MLTKSCRPSLGEVTSPSFVLVKSHVKEQEVCLSFPWESYWEMEYRLYGDWRTVHCWITALQASGACLEIEILCIFTFLFALAVINDHK